MSKTTTAIWCRHSAGFTPRRLQPWETHELLDAGYGLTNLVARATTTAAELATAELARVFAELRFSATEEPGAQPGRQ